MGTECGIGSESWLQRHAVSEARYVRGNWLDDPPPSVATPGGVSPCPRHAAGRISPAGGAVSGPGFGVPLFGAATTVLALSQAASRSGSFMNR